MSINIRFLKARRRNCYRYDVLKEPAWRLLLFLEFPLSSECFARSLPA
jgi:hypothetical protein